ncbi:hypothetical protein DY000_02041547 [Brassica cretica]|uniref:Uncharacterized protein n=1 Tax=Brassica cretica TaxID=69181 RepID=A0ABQ7BNQ6_BRACR|nr:hypothetical protein DY000_02041547 [Brassica cretica]
MSNSKQLSPKIEITAVNFGSHTNPVGGCSSKSCPNGLAAIRSFCRVPELVEFLLPEAGQVAGSLPEGYFTCYEAYLMQCHLWFPIPEVILQLHNRFKLSIGQINPCGLQHIVRILVLKTNPLPPNPEGLRISRNLLRGGPSIWATFAPKRVRHAVALHHSRFQPDLPVEEMSELSMDGFVPCEVRAKRERSSQLGGSGGEQINLDGLLDFDFPPAKGGDLTQITIRSELLSQIRGGSSKVQEFTKASRMVNGSLLMMNRALDASNQDARMAQFRAETADNEIARLKDESECSRPSERGSLRQRFIGSYKALKDPEYPFDVEYARQTGCMNERDKDFVIPKIEERIWEQWDPIPASPDTVEAETRAVGVKIGYDRINVGNFPKNVLFEKER